MFHNQFDTETKLNVCHLLSLAIRKNVGRNLVALKKTYMAAVETLTIAMALGQGNPKR
jgi:hypothetical protein